MACADLGAIGLVFGAGLMFGAAVGIVIMGCYMEGLK